MALALKDVYQGAPMVAENRAKGVVPDVAEGVNQLVKEVVLHHVRDVQVVLGALEAALVVLEAVQAVEAAEAIVLLIVEGLVPGAVEDALEPVGLPWEHKKGKSPLRNFPCSYSSHTTKYIISNIYNFFTISSKQIC